MTNRLQIAGWTALILIFFGFILHLMGRIPFCECGIGLWTSNAQGNDTSQLLADPYSASHLLHGILFYWGFRMLFPKLKAEHWFLLAVVLEVGWEILENTPLIINRYREGTASQDYFGDSIWNSFGDVFSMMIGFWLSLRLGWKWGLAIIVAVELIMLYFYRDNLTLNILMLLLPIDAIREWQMS